MSGKGNEGHFKTPLGPKKLAYDETDEDEASSTSSTGSDNDNLSLLAEFDEITRTARIVKHDRDEIYKSFTDIVGQFQNMLREQIAQMEECKRLKNVLDEKTQAISDLETQLSRARSILDEERKHKCLIEDERNYLNQQVFKAKQLLFEKYRGQLSDDAYKQLEFLKNTNSNMNSSFQADHNSTECSLPDYCYSRSEDDLDFSYGKWRKHKPSVGNKEEPAAKKRRSSVNKVVEISNAETVRATTTVSVPQTGPIVATSVIETVPTFKQQNVVERYNLNTSRSHSFQLKKIVKPENCVVCKKKMYFGKSTVKCKDCKVLCHISCKENVPLPCVPCAQTPIKKSNFGSIADHTPTTSPMVPAFLVHCITELESRGLNVLGLYRVPGSEGEVKDLKEKLLRLRGTPNLSDVDVHTLTSVIKSFLRSLDEKLITTNTAKDFIAAINARNIVDITPAILQTFSEMPQPNRDTLAYILVHLQHVSNTTECSMPVSNLAKVFALTLMPSPKENENMERLGAQVTQNCMVLEFLLNLPTSFYSNILKESRQKNARIQQIPSSESLFQLNGPSTITPRMYVNQLKTLA